MGNSLCYQKTPVVHDYTVQLNYSSYFSEDIILFYMCPSPVSNKMGFVSVVEKLCSLAEG